jgi:hypothetical protein
MSLQTEIKPAPYYNDLQLAVELSNKLHKMVIAGRGAGKTTLFGNEFIKYLKVMPRGKYSMNGLTYFHLKTKSLPLIIDHFERRGLIRDQHYFVGHKAPRKLKWDEPFQPPLDYTHCIHFVNGFVIELNSFDRPEMARSGSYDGMGFDETTKLKESAINSDVLPANRGNKDRFGNIIFHHGTLFLGTQPLTPDGDWVFKYIDLMKEYPQTYAFIEASARVNIKVLGEDYFRDLRRGLPQIVYDIEIENKRRTKNANRFYPMLSAGHGYYFSYNYVYYDTIDYDVNKQGGIDSRGDSDCLKDEPLYVSFDFGSTQNCCIVAQNHKSVNEFPIIKNFYVENQTLTVLVRKFIDYYEHHVDKTVFLYGGSDGTRRNDAASRQTYFDDVTDQLVKAGWSVYLRAELYEISHMDKFIFWNKFLSGDFHEVPAFKINMNNALETYVSMDNAPALPSEFKKDKSSERKTDQPRWKATDLSDAVDNLYFWLFDSSIGEQDPSSDMCILS